MKKRFYLFFDCWLLGESENLKRKYSTNISGNETREDRKFIFAKQDRAFLQRPEFMIFVLPATKFFNVWRPLIKF